MRGWIPFNVVAQVGCVSEFKNCTPSCACVSVIFQYVCLRLSLFIYRIAAAAAAAATVYLYACANWILEVSQMKIKPSFILGCMDIVIFLGAAISPYRLQCTVSIGKRGHGSGCCRRGYGCPRYEKYENNADVLKYKAPNRYFHHVLR